MSYDFCPAIYQRPSFDCGHNKMDVALQNFATYNFAVSNDRDCYFLTIYLYTSNL